MFRHFLDNLKTRAVHVVCVCVCVCVDPLLLQTCGFLLSVCKDHLVVFIAACCLFVCVCRRTCGCVVLHCVYCNKGLFLKEKHHSRFFLSAEMSRSRFRLVKQEAASCDSERKLLVQKISVIKTPVHPKCVFQYRYVYKHLKSPNHGFLKMTVHVVWTIALRE